MSSVNGLIKSSYLNFDRSLIHPVYPERERERETDVRVCPTMSMLFSFIAA